MRNSFLVFFLLCCTTVFAQQTRDSLLNALANHPQQDTTRVNLLTALSMNSWGIEPQKNLENSTEALKLSKSLHFLKGEADSYREIGRYYWSQTEYTRCMDYCLSAQKVYQQLGDMKGVSWCYGTIGLNYCQANNGDKGIQYHKMALELNTKIGHKKGIARDLNNLGYANEIKKDYTAALDYYSRALQMRISIGDTADLVSPMLNVGSINQLLKRYDAALPFTARALALARKMGNRNQMAVAYQNMGEISFLQNDRTRAIAYLKIALDIANELGDRKRREEVYRLLRDAEASVQNYEAAFQYGQHYEKIKDTLYTQEQSMKMAEMEAREEREKKEQALQLLERDNRIQTLWTNMLIAGILMIVLIFLLVLRLQRFREKKNQELLGLQIDLLTGQNQILAAKYQQAIIGTNEDAVESADQRLLRQALEVVERNISDPQFSVEKLADELAMSRASLHRRLRSVTGFSPSDFIRNVRLKRAANLLRNNADSVSRIGFSVGFEDQSYFSKAFKKQFGVSPSEFSRLAPSVVPQDPPHGIFTR